MPRYDFRGRTCDQTFEVDRPMAQASDPAPCPSGHADTVKLIRAFASVGRAGEGAAATPAPMPMGGGGCCGGACGCG